MRYATVCSGIEAPSAAWHPLGWEPAFFSEIDPFPCAALAHHYPRVPNLGDMTRFKDWPDAAFDVLCGGTPCQSFSVAGLRKGLDDPRGNLMLTYLAIAARYRPRRLVWENVPGVLSVDGGRAFAAFLGGLGQLGYGFAYRVLDAQYYGVPQRRRRVFVVGCLGDWRAAAAILFERHSLQGHPAPSREAGERASGFAPSSIGGYREGTGTPRAHGGDRGGGSETLIAAPDIARCIATREGTSQDWETTTMVAHSLRAEGFDASEDGTGRGTPLVPVTAGTLKANNGGGGFGSDPSETFIPIGYTITGTNKTNRVAFETDIAGAIRTKPPGSIENSSSTVVAMNLRGREGGAMPECDELASLRAASGGSSRSYVADMRVRRLTPRECERLQGFPDDYTLISYRGKPATDGPRYKALGNSMAVPVVRWLGERIQMIDALEFA